MTSDGPPTNLPRRRRRPARLSPVISSRLRLRLTLSLLYPISSSLPLPLPRARLPPPPAPRRRCSRRPWPSARRPSSPARPGGRRTACTHARSPQPPHLLLLLLIIILLLGPVLIMACGGELDLAGDGRRLVAWRPDGGARRSRVRGSPRASRSTPVATVMVSKGRRKIFGGSC